MQEIRAITQSANTFAKTDRTTVSRLPQNATYDKSTVYRILDESFICHVGFVSNGKPVVVPTAYGRVDDNLYIHGAPASRMLRSLQSGIDACVTVTLIDGLVLARSAFNHTFNYRSVMIFGKAQQVTNSQEKLQAFSALSEHIIKERWHDARKPNEKELAGTLILSLPLQEVSAKVRTGPPVDDPEDMSLPIWAGEIPLSMLAGQPVSDPHASCEIEPPAYAKAYRRQSNGK